jgi:hypothetical protein
MTVTLRVGPGARPLGWKENEVLADGAEVGDCGPFISPHNGRMDSATLFYNAHTPQVQARSIFQLARQMRDATVSLTFATEHDGQAGMWVLEYAIGVAWSLWCGPASKLRDGSATADA